MLQNEQPTTIGSRITTRRREMGLSMAELARRSDISRGYLHTLENDSERNPTVLVLLKIAKALHTTIGDLAGESGYYTVENGNRPENLQRFARLNRLPEIDVAMLEQIHYRGEYPQTLDDYWFLLEAIRRACIHGKPDV